MVDVVGESAGKAVSATLGGNSKIGSDFWKVVGAVTKFLSEAVERDAKQNAIDAKKTTNSSEGSGYRKAKTGDQ